MIPRIIHRIWLREEIPDPFNEWGQRWMDLHPGWDLIDWTAEPDDLPDLFYQAKEQCDDDWKRWEADILRLVLLERYGGVYADMDIEPLKNLEPLLSGKHCVVGRSPYKRAGKHPITNAFMASVPNHPYISELIRTLDDGARRSGDLAYRIGPWHLTRIYEAYPWAVTVIDDLYGQDWFQHFWNSGRRRRGEGLA